MQKYLDIYRERGRILAAQGSEPVLPLNHVRDLDSQIDEDDATRHANASHSRIAHVYSVNSITGAVESEVAIPENLRRAADTNNKSFKGSYRGISSELRNYMLTGEKPRAYLAN